MTFSRPPVASFGGLSDAALTQMEAACEAFEAAWKSGAAPGAEAYWSAGGDGGELLLFELLGIEAHYRRHDPAFNEEECARRFPEFAEAIAAWFRDRRLSPGNEQSGASRDESATAPGSTLPIDAAETGLLAGDAENGAGRFRALRPYASGGLGEIWLARDEELGRDVALKQIKARFADDPQCQARFVREAEITGRLEHPGIAPVYGFGRDRRGRPIYAMRLLGGETLHEAIDRWHAGGARPGVEFRKLLRQLLDVCNVVEFAHRRGFIHRDLKPRNIMLGEFGETVVLDWGLARELADKELAPDERAAAADDDADRTLPGAQLGTPGYMSPEQAWGLHNELTPASDVFSLGAMLYSILTGASPYGHVDGSDAIEQAKVCRFAHPREKNLRVPPALEAICLKAMSVETGKRYPSALALADDIERWLADEPITARCDGWTTRLFRWSRRHKTLVTAAAAAGIVLLIALTAMIVQQRRAQERIVERNRVIERQRDESYTQIEREQINRAARLIEQPDEARDALRSVPVSRRGWEWRRLSYDLGLRPHGLTSLPGHDWGVLDLAWHAPTDTLVTAGHDGRLLLWRGGAAPEQIVAGSWSNERLAWRHALFDFADDPSDRKEADCFLRLAWLEPGVELVAVSLRGKLTRWSLHGGGPPPRRELASHDRPLFAVATRGESILCGDDQGGLLWFDGEAAAHKPLASTAAVLELLALPDRRWAVAQQDGTVSLLDEPARRVVARFAVAAPAWGLDVSPDKTVLAVAGGDARVDCYDIGPGLGSVVRKESYQAPPDLSPAPTAMQTVRFSPDGEWLAAGDDRGRLLAWERKSGKFTLSAPTLRVLTAGQAETLPTPFQRRLAAIAFSPDGKECRMAGHDPVVRNWQVRGDRGITRIELGNEPRVRFDPARPDLLWAGGGDGTLTVWHSRQRRQVARVHAHSGPIVAIDAAPSAAANGGSLIATCVQTGDIRFWSLRETQLAPLPNAIQHGSPLDAIALSRDAERIAGYDRSHRVLVWQRATGRLLATRKLDEEGQPPPRPCVAFNADGTRLAAFGPGAMLWVLHAADLSVAAKPAIIAGRGGTALVWHPREADTLFAGDDLGRLARHPSGEWGRLNLQLPPVALVGLGWSPLGDGGRLAAGYRNGEIQIIDPKWAGFLVTLQLAHGAEGRSPLSDLLFDPRGERLAAVCQDGALEIWETPAEPPAAASRPPRRWRRRELASGEKLVGLELRRQAVALDNANRLTLLATSCDDGQHLSAPEAEGRRLMLIRERDDEVRTESQPRRAVARSLALAFSGDEWFATVRRPLPEEGGYSGAFLLLRGRETPGMSEFDWTEEDLTPRGNNDGFDPQLLFAKTSLPSVVHFTHSGSYLLSTWHDGTEWQTTRLGRQGDGFKHLTAAAPSGGSLYSVFSPNGLNGKKCSLTCLVTDWNASAANAVFGQPLPTVQREICDSTYGAGACSLAIDAGGIPALLYVRPADDQREDLLLARRTATGWKSSRVFARAPHALSNLLFGPKGELCFAYLSPDDGAIYLATGDGGKWSTETVADLLEVQGGASGQLDQSELVLLRDGDGRPLIIACVRRAQSGELAAFRLDE